MNEKIKNCLSSVEKVINKLPFKNLSEKYSEKVPFLKKVAPFANFIVCGLVVLVVVVKIALPQVYFNSYMSKVENAWRDEARSYDAVDQSDDFKAAYDKAVAEINACTLDRNGLKKISEIKDEFEKQAEELQQVLNAKDDEIAEAVNVRIAEIGNYEYQMSTGQFKKYQKLTEELPNLTKEAWENFYLRNNTIYRNYANELNKVYLEKIDKINEAIKEADRKTYIETFQKNIVGHWFARNYNKEFIFDDDGTFMYYFHKRDMKLIEKPNQVIYLEDGSVQIGTVKTMYFQMESKYSGKYHFEGDMVVLDVTYAFYENTTPVRPGDQLKMKVRYGQNNKGSFLILDSLSYKREK